VPVRWGREPAVPLAVGRYKRQLHDFKLLGPIEHVAERVSGGQRRRLVP
jgi:hypothetical protein